MSHQPSAVPLPEARAEQLAAANRRLVAARDEIRAILRDDLADYPSRATRDRYVNTPKWSSTLAPVEVGALKRDAESLGRTHAAEVYEALEQESWWASAYQVPTEGRGTLESIGELWALIAAVDQQLLALWGRYGLLEGDTPPPSYAPPKRFVNGRYLKSALESFWRAMAEVEKYQAQQAEVEQLASRTELAKRWEDA